jgi:hypothetical protein
MFGLVNEAKPKSPKQTLQTEEWIMKLSKQLHIMLTETTTTNQQQCQPNKEEHNTLNSLSLSVLPWPNQAGPSLLRRRQTLNRTITTAITIKTSTTNNANNDKQIKHRLHQPLSFFRHIFLIAAI